MIGRMRRWAEWKGALVGFFVSLLVFFAVLAWLVWVAPLIMEALL